MTVVTCAPLVLVENGEYTYSKPLLLFESFSRYSIGTVAYLTCDDGYDIYGEKNRICQNKRIGRWSGEAAECLSSEAKPIHILPVELFKIKICLINKYV